MSVLECSVGGLRPHLCQFSPSPQPSCPHTNTLLQRQGETESAQARGRQPGFSHTTTPVYPFCGVIYKGFNGGHLHKVYRRLRRSVCQMRAALRRASKDNAKSPPPALLSPAPLGILPCPPVRGSEERGGGGGGDGEGGGGPGRLMCPL